jgi:hypothetical protein
VSDASDDRLEDRAPAYELAFVEAGRALDAQERAVNELRSRAGILIALAERTYPVVMAKPKSTAPPKPPPPQPIKPSPMIGEMGGRRKPKPKP